MSYRRSDFLLRYNIQLTGKRGFAKPFVCTCEQPTCGVCACEGYLPFGGAHQAGARLFLSD
jgi:hypothetical protein